MRARCVAVGSACGTASSMDGRGATFGRFARLLPLMVDLSPCLEIASATHPGMVRPHNEDSIASDPALGLAVLADGMGGYNAGEVASGIAVALISTEMKTLLTGQDAGEFTIREIEQLIAEYAAKANAAIYQAAQGNPQYSGMGTTLVLALWHDDQIAVGHIGDSRLYRLRGGALEQVTRDHSVLQEQIDSGMITRQQARHAQHKNLVTRAVGIDPQVETEVHAYPAQVDDIYLLCSDGLPDMVEDEDIQLTLTALKANLQLAAEQLVQQANDNGGRDNISVILVRVRKAFPMHAGMLQKLRTWFK